MKFKLFVEYDGTRYSGWQKQNNNVRTIQGTLINTITDVFSKSKGSGKFIDLQGAGRTDSGVHAIEQVAHLECTTMLAPHILQMKINDILPSDINILHIEQTNDKFHARHSALSRQYLYRISRRRNAFEKKYLWWIKDDLDTEYMKHISKLFPGMKDFSSFSEQNKEDRSPKVLLERLDIEDKDDLILIRMKASHFLWKMVRRIVGVLVEAGRRNVNEEIVQVYLNKQSNEPARFTAPPSGLFLEKIYY